MNFIKHQSVRATAKNFQTGKNSYKTTKIIAATTKLYASCNETYSIFIFHERIRQSAILSVRKKTSHTHTTTHISTLTQTHMNYLKIKTIAAKYYCDVLTHLVEIVYCEVKCSKISCRSTKWIHKLLTK